MVRIVFSQKDGFFQGFSTSGHAEYDEEGYDIVCAAVSALTQTALAGLLEQLEAADAVQWKLEKGYLETELPDGLGKKDRETAQVLLKALCTGLTMIQKQYPDYVTVERKKNGR